LDFGGTALEGTFDLVTSASAITAFSANQFSIVNLGAGYTGTVGLTANALQITVSAIPEPSAFAALAGLAALGGAITRRRRRAV
ncbi:MAG: PEP-CTERM sorting domain-containing protein, partial [Opitutaceae bacterium]|nr:PEP-CTERM sorting domain-containing protein [Opitutaceae bacterium]